MFGCVRSSLLNQIGKPLLDRRARLLLRPLPPGGSAHLHVSECDPPGHRRGGQRMARQWIALRHRQHRVGGISAMK